MTNKYVSPKIALSQDVKYLIKFIVDYYRIIRTSDELEICNGTKFYLSCVIPEFGYSVGDIISVGIHNNRFVSQDKVSGSIRLCVLSNNKWELFFTLERTN